MSQNEVVLFGASCGGMIAYESFKAQHNIIAFCDNDAIKWGKTLAGLPIINPKDIPTTAKVIIASSYIGDITSQLEAENTPVLWPESMAFAENLDRHMDRCLSEYLDGIEQPIFVYHMGKVGSTSVETLVGANAMDYFSCIGLNDKAVMHLRNYTLKRPVKIISLVRDPIARDVASIFHFFPDTTLNNRALFESVSQMDVTTVFSMVLKHTGNSAIDWFQNELTPHTGIDVFAYPFDREGVSSRIQQGNIDLLLLKLERIDDSCDAISDFLGVEVDSIPKVNIAARKWYASLYDEFKTNFKADEDYLKLMYDSGYARHFYSDEELAHFRAKWSR